MSNVVTSLRCDSCEFEIIWTEDTEPLSVFRRVDDHESQNPGHDVKRRAIPGGRPPHYACDSCEFGGCGWNFEEWRRHRSDNPDHELSFSDCDHPDH